MAEDNLDLARVCPGNPNGSVTEKVAYALSQEIRQADYYIDLHTGGTELAATPLTGYTLHPDPVVLQTQRRMADAFNLPLIWGTSPALEGRSLSVARDANIPAIYAEYLGSATCHPAGVAACYEGCLNVMRELQMIEHPIPQSRVMYRVEDPRLGSGHLQICNPAPMMGLFVPAVKLSDHIWQGDRIGTVSDLLGDQSMDILAEQAGIVIMLRTFPYVKQGDSVGVVLEIK